MRVGLRTRFLLPPAVLLVGTIIATGWAARQAARTAESQIETRLNAVEQTLKNLPNFRLSAPVLMQMRTLTGAEFLLVDRLGDRLSTFPVPERVPIDFADTDDDETDRVDSRLSSPIPIEGVAYRAVQLRIRPPHPNEGERLYLYYPETLRQTAVRDAVRPALWLGGVGGLVAVAISALTSRRIVRLVRELEARLRGFATGTFEPLKLPKTDDELRDLYRSVNEIARQTIEYETQLKANERLRILGEFSGGLAHQLRSAASGAKLSLQLFVQDSDSTDREPIEVALRQLERIERTLQQLLTFGRQERTEFTKLEPFEILDQSVRLLQPQARHAGTTLTQTPLKDDLIASDFWGNSDQLGHVFTNIISNALDAAGPDGSVEVCAELESTGGRRVTVTDTGSGVPPEIAARLFEPFVTGRAQGIGLGLVVARQAAILHGGTVEWHRDGQRTRFVILLKGDRSESETTTRCQTTT